MDKSFLAAKQEGSILAGPKYEKALEFFIRRRSSQIDVRANSKDIEREEFIKYCKDNGLRKGKTVLDRYSKQFYFWNPSEKSDTFVV